MGARRRTPARSQGGFVMIALIALLVAGALYFVVRNLSPETLLARGQQKTDAALAQAREALVGYAVRFRDEQLQTGNAGIVYGYLPLPDLGTSRNNNAGCAEEGCDAANFAGNGPNVTVIGRFPWRTLGTGPLRDGEGECLWYAVSGSHQRIQQASPMNWDTLGHLDVVIANGTAAMAGAIAAATAHDRPIAVIFSPGPPLPGQNRNTAPGDNVTECGGNYVVTNYLDPVVAANLGGVTNYFAGATNDASGDTSAAAKPLSAGGAVNRRADAGLWAGKCPPNDAGACDLVANDRGATLTGDAVFATLRNSSYFRADINAMLERMVGCLRDQIAAGPGFAPDALAGVAAPADKTVGRISADACYDDTQQPLGYFSHWRDQVFVAARVASDFTVTDTKNTPGANDDGSASCPGVLLFAGQRGTKSPVPADAGESAIQLRTTAAVSVGNPVLNRDWPANYLEGGNLTSFTTAGALAFGGPTQLTQVLATTAAAQTASQDIVRCIPAGASFSTVTSPVLATLGYGQLSAYDPGTRTVTLGALNVRTGTGAPGYALYGCAWTPETHLTANGLRAYFRFRIVDRGDGFVFAMADGDRNSANACGAARQHLGFSGNNDPDQSSNGLLPSITNNETPIIAHPKIGIEFDNTRAGTFSTTGSPLSSGRNDPCYASGSCPLGATGDNNAHVSIVYWGGEAVIPAATNSSPIEACGVGGACSGVRICNLSSNICQDPVPCTPAGECPTIGFDCTTLGRCPAMRFCNSADNMCYLRPEFDDNVHSLPIPPDASARPAPRNPPPLFPFPNPVSSPAPGVAALDRLGSTDAAERDFHVRVELARTYSDTATTDPMNRKATVKVETWIVAEGGNAGQIAAVKNTTRPMAQLYPGFAPTLSNDGIRYDEPRGACVAGVCPAGQSCDTGSNTCYSNGPPTVHDLPMGACSAADPNRPCNGPPLLKRNPCTTSGPNCTSGKCCPSAQSCGADGNCYDVLHRCGADNICYAEAFRTLRLGFTNGQGTQDQVINITDFIATWLP